LKSTAEKGVHINLDDMIEFAKDGIVSKTLVKTAGREISLFCMSEGQVISTHTSSFPAAIHIIRGMGEVTLAKEKFEAKPNALFYMPAKLPHAIQATENLVFLLTLFKQTKQ
jgi:nitric oxide dioxygenase